MASRGVGLGASTGKRMADSNKRKIAEPIDLNDDDPFAELTRIMGFDPRLTKRAEPVVERLRLWRQWRRQGPRLLSRPSRMTISASTSKRN